MVCGWLCFDLDGLRYSEYLDKISLLILAVFTYNKSDPYAKLENDLTEGPKHMPEQLLRFLQAGHMSVCLVGGGVPGVSAAVRGTHCDQYVSTPALSQCPHEH